MECLLCIIFSNLFLYHFLLLYLKDSIFNFIILFPVSLLFYLLFLILYLLYFLLLFSFILVQVYFTTKQIFHLKSLHLKTLKISSFFFQISFHSNYYLIIYYSVSLLILFHVYDYKLKNFMRILTKVLAN